MHTAAPHASDAAPTVPVGDVSTWQAALARMCCDLAPGPVIEDGHAALDQAWALRSVRRAARQLEQVLATEVASDETWRAAVSAGALTLRAYRAAVAHVTRADPGARPELAQRLGAALAAHERSLLAAASGDSLSPGLVRSAGRDVALAFLRLRVGSRSHQDAVAEAEDRAIGLALLSVRAANNVTRFGRAAGPRRAPSRPCRQASVAAGAESRASGTLVSG